VALRTEAARRIDRLRLESDMPHHGDAALDEEANRLGHLAAAFDLDAAAAGYWRIARRFLR
jgi:hypothetical protein